VSLGPLSSDETARLVESLLGRDPADETFRATVVERSAGNPLYADGFVRMQASGGALEGLPDSVLGIVTARVDLLPPAEKELLRDAAVMGGVVWSDGLRAVSDHDEETVDGILRSLGRKEFLRRERRSAVQGATEHSFVHTLVRDAVYGQLPRPDRVDRHMRVARWIESLPEDRREDRAEMLAHHYLEAIDLSRSAGLDASELEPAAAAALREAGMRAFAIGAFPAAVRALRRAAEWLPGGLDARALRALGTALSFTENTGEQELQLAYDRVVDEGIDVEAAVTATFLSLAHWRHGDGAAAAEWSARALELIAGAGRTAQRVDVLAHAARYKMVAGFQEESIALADEAIALADSLGATGARLSALITRATARASGGMYETAIEDLRQAISVGDVENPFELSRAHNNLGSVLLDLGDIAGAIEVEREGYALCERIGTADGFGRFLKGNLTEALFFAGEWGEAERLSIEGLEHAERTGGQYHEPLFTYVLAELGLGRDGRAEEATAAARRLVELSRERGDDQIVLPGLSMAAWLFARTGCGPDAELLVDELLARRPANPKGIMAGYWTTLLALTLERLERPGALAALDEPEGSHFLDAALAVEEGRFADAARTLAVIGAPQLEAEAHVLAARGASDASVHLVRARELFESLSATARLQQLDATSSSRSA
jgi:tetratricopeptide (TPR) repeat protein